MLYSAVYPEKWTCSFLKYWHHNISVKLYNNAHTMIKTAIFEYDPTEKKTSRIHLCKFNLHHKGNIL